MVAGSGAVCSCLEKPGKTHQHTLFFFLILGVFIKE